MKPQCPEEDPLAFIDELAHVATTVALALAGACVLIAAISLL